VRIQPFELEKDTIFQRPFDVNKVKKETLRFASRPLCMRLLGCLDALRNLTH